MSVMLLAGYTIEYYIFSCYFVRLRCFGEFLFASGSDLRYLFSVFCFSSLLTCFVLEQHLKGMVFADTTDEFRRKKSLLHDYLEAENHPHVHKSNSVFNFGLFLSSSFQYFNVFRYIKFFVCVCLSVCFIVYFFLSI